MCELSFLPGTLKIVYAFPKDAFVYSFIYNFPNLFVQENLELRQFSWWLPNLHVRISWTLYILKNRYRSEVLAFFDS